METMFTLTQPLIANFNDQIFLSHTHMINERLRKQFHSRRNVLKIDSHDKEN